MNTSFINILIKPQIFFVLLFVALFFFFCDEVGFAQTATNTVELIDMAEKFQQIYAREKEEAIDFAVTNNLAVREELPDGTIIEIQKTENGVPLYYITVNSNAAISTRTDKLWAIPFSLTGSGYTKVGEWDSGAVRSTHQEFGSPTRVTQVDSPASTSNHSTHVAGTIIASGVDAYAKGMAYQSDLKAYDWNSDKSEMAAAGPGGMEVSNHSYEYITGWYGSSHWFGDTSIDPNEAYRFGFYDTQAQDWDDIAYNAPYYLIVKAAGNNRNDYAPASGTPHSHNFSGSYTDTHYDDGFDNGGFDTIGAAGVAKNVLTVGAVSDVSSYALPSDVVMSYFSGWGPADDGRIKPDIVGNGIGLYSTSAAGDSSYTTMSGTSMASPNVTGTLALLQQHYQNTHSGISMRSATLKALVIHTADESGDAMGPDYKFGWGLLNAQKAANKISEDNSQNVIDEQTLSNGAIYTRVVTVAGSNPAPLVVTVVWTDPTGTPVLPALDPSDVMLVNDLDLRVTNNGTTYYPWKLDKSNPTNAATNSSENDVDNVEQVYIETPTAGTYTIEVDHDGTLASSQAFSIVISGIDEFTSDVCGDVSGTWTSGNTYIVTCDIVVNSGQSLTIESGEVINNLENYGFTVNGAMTWVP